MNAKDSGEFAAVDKSTGHAPDARQTSGRWRVDCSCGWRGPVVPLPGQGYVPWVAHYEVSSDVRSGDLQSPTE